LVLIESVPSLFIKTKNEIFENDSIFKSKEVKNFMNQENTEISTKIKKLEEALAERYEATEILVKEIIEKNNYLDLKENFLKDRNYVINQLKLEINSKESEITNLNGILNIKNNNINSLEKELNDCILEINKLKLELDVLTDNIRTKDKELDVLTDNIRTKDKELDVLTDNIRTKEIELIHFQDELNSLKSSWLFKKSTQIAVLIDKMFPLGTKSGEFKEIIVHSLRHIQNYGFTSFFSAVKIKWSRKEFVILESLTISGKDENDLLLTVKKNRGNRLKLKPHSKEEIFLDQIDILDEKFPL
jgi:chromosome segregation ATPase